MASNLNKDRYLYYYLYAVQQGKSCEDRNEEQYAEHKLCNNPSLQQSRVVFRELIPASHLSSGARNPVSVFCLTHAQRFH